MKLAGFLLLPAGWGIVLTSLVLFDGTMLRNLFVIAGISLQTIGVALIFHRMRHQRAVIR